MSCSGISLVTGGGTRERETERNRLSDPLKQGGGSWWFFGWVRLLRGGAVCVCVGAGRDRMLSG